MADQKTSELDEITEFAAGDLLYVARPGSDEQKKITAANAIPAASEAVAATGAATFKRFDTGKIAADNSGIALVVHPSYCFTDRSVDASTQAELGDEVQTIKSADGSWFIIAHADGTGATLAQDDTGKYYLQCDDSTSFEVQDDQGANKDPGTSWTILVAQEGAGRSFATSGTSTNNTRYIFASVENTGIRVQIRNSSDANEYVVVGDDIPIARTFNVPFVARIVQVANTSIEFFWEDHPIPAKTGVVPYDDSAIARELNIAASRGGSGGYGNAFTGRLYGFFYVPDTLTDLETYQVTQELLAVCKAESPIQYDKEPVILDFENDTFSWAGRTRSLSDLTDNGSDSYTLNYTGWWQQEHTVVVEAEVDSEAGDWSGTILEMVAGHTVDEAVRVNPQLNESRLEFESAGGGQEFPQCAAYFTLSSLAGRSKVAFIHRPGKPMNIFAAHGTDQSTEDHFGTASRRPTHVDIDISPPGWTVHRVEIYPSALDGQDLYDAMNHTNTIHVLGDSFVIFLGTDFNEALSNQMITEDAEPPTYISKDGAGGLMFYEPDGRGHSQRFALTPAHWGKTLVLNDGGFGSKGEYINSWSVAQALQYLTHDGDKRYVLLQPNPINAIGAGSRTSHDALMDEMREITGDHFVEMLESMFCAYDPNEAQDLTDIGNGIWPDSLRVDSTHYNLTGQDIYAHACHGAMIELGYIAGTEGVPGVVQNLIDTAGTITWDAPADDGGHPVMGYLIEKDDSGAWNNQTAQGSPTGYTKQYIRSWDAPEADTYRVSAINRAGAGATTEVVVS